MHTKMSPTIGKLVEALVKVQSKLQPAKKDSQNPFFKSFYADLASVWDVSRDLLATNGLAVIQHGGMREQGPTLITTLAHISGEWISGEYLLVTSKQNDAQSLGASMTYARRYSLAAILGVVSDDDDAEGAMNRGGALDKKVQQASVHLTVESMRETAKLVNQQDPLEFWEDAPDETSKAEKTSRPDISTKIINTGMRFIGGKSYGTVGKEKLVEEYKSMAAWYKENGKKPFGYRHDFMKDVEIYCAELL